MRWLRPLARRLARTSYLKRAIEEQADLSAFKGRPSTRLAAGVVLIIIAQLMGWPTVTGFGVAAALLKEPWLLLGGPAAYLISWGIWGLGLLLAGPDCIKYANIFLRWAARTGVERVLGPEAAALSGPVGEQDDSGDPTE